MARALPDIIRIDSITNEVVQAAAREIDIYLRWERLQLQTEGITGPHEVVAGNKTVVQWAFWRDDKHAFSLILTSTGVWFATSEEKFVTVNNTTYSTPHAQTLESVDLSDPELFTKVKIGIKRYTGQYGI